MPAGAVPRSTPLGRHRLEAGLTVDRTIRRAPLKQVLAVKPRGVRRGRTATVDPALSLTCADALR
jgi:hypothetical protein